METSPSDNLQMQLTAYLDGELSPSEVAQLEQRLRDEPALRRELASFMRLRDELEGLANHGPQIDYAAQRENIRCALERQMLLKAPQRRSARRMLPFALAGLAAAAAVVIVAVSANLMSPGNSSTQGPIAQSDEGNVQVRVLPLAAAPAVDNEARVGTTMRRMEPSEYRIKDRRPKSLVPAGTIAVSTTPEENAGGSGLPYPVIIE